jgi:HK97 family phage prohead protease
MPDTITRDQRRELYIPHRLEIVGDGEAHRITAIASTPELDRYGTRIVSGGMRPVRGVVPLLLGHDRQRAIGSIDRIEASADDLEIEATITDEATWASIKAGVLGGVSVGFIIHNVHQDGDTLVITDWELVEIRLVTTPANPDARIVELRSAWNTPSSAPAATVRAAGASRRGPSSRKQRREPTSPRPARCCVSFARIGRCRCRPSIGESRCISASAV